ncbi:hypothetical protein BOVMAS10_12140 [Streptococcus uberis]|uniref:hypothetical protein n=1 Tax=Streptococcus uberis TaxID=1349 RepID=UPI000A9EA82C|nr:hypothetical protein [Streptococcus uberis]
MKNFAYQPRQSSQLNGWYDFCKIMEWIDYALFEPKNKEEIKNKIINDGYTFPHYDKSRNKVRYTISVLDIERDCKKCNISPDDVYPLQISLF